VSNVTNDDDLSFLVDEALAALKASGRPECRSLHAQILEEREALAKPSMFSKSRRTILECRAQLGLTLAAFHDSVARADDLHRRIQNQLMTSKPKIEINKAPNP
jgi:hypothetical protein